MGVVERALKKIQQDNQRRSGAGGSAPVGRVITEPRKDASDVRPGGGFIELDFDGLRDAGLYAGGNSRLADEYRAIKQPILRKAAAHTHDPENALRNLVMVASSSAAEGKTFTCLNLALSLAAERDWNVLIVDGDCRKPHLSRLLGVADEPGLLDLLKQDNVDVQSVIMATNVKGLSVLPLGGRDDQSSELLASERMSQLCRSLSQADSRRIVLFDSSPLLLTPEASIMSSHVGQVIMVVRANETPQNAVLQAIESIDASNSIGLVLNLADQTGDALGYGYAYGDSSYGYPQAETSA